MKLQYSVYGNCQSSALAQCLSKVKSFQERYEYIPLKAVQKINLNEIKSVESIFSQLDLLIYQHISDRYRISELSTNRLLKCLPNNSTLISIPSLYFNGYFPHLDGLSGLKSITNLVHDFNILAGYVKNIPENNLYNMIKHENFYSAEETNNFLMNSISNLKKREFENKVDITISPIISKFYSEARLFNHFNHPTGFLFSFLVVAILDKLRIPYQDSEIQLIKESEPAGAICYSIYPSTAHHLNLKFPNDFANARVQGSHNIKYSYRELIHAFYHFYDSVDNKLKLSQTLESKKAFILEKMDKNL